MNRRPRRILCLMAALFMARLLSSHAADDETPKGLLDKIGEKINYLAEPGDLCLSHSHIDKPNECGRCHTLKTGLSVEKCLECHKEIERRLKEKTGYHGTLTDKCWKCHTDHKGRDTRIVKLDERAFNHQQAAFSLKGAHQDADCGACHRSKQANASGRTKESFIGLPQTCRECHGDPHQDQLSGNCQDCHNERGWKSPNLSFDHDKTSFTLTGKHAALQCGECHGDGNFKFESVACSACHKDPHAGQFERSCDRCHDEGGWKGRFLLFNHNQNSRFKLKGHHLELQCAKCHGDGNYKFESVACAACHKDPHAGQFEQSCDRCHTEEGWSGRFLLFDHTKDSRFELTGLHRGLQCNGCHKEGRYASRENACGACHEGPHEGRLGTRCEKCHDAEGPWKTSWSRLGDHSKTRFPLDATHDGLNCRKCHAEGTLATPGFKCEDCHRDVEEFYQGVFPQTRPANLAPRGSKPKPDPMHGKVPCAACHAPSDRRADLGAIVQRCVACHAPEYADYAGSWTSLIIQEARRAGNAVDSAEEKEFIEQVDRLAPHNFQFARQQLRAISEKQGDAF